MPSDDERTVGRFDRCRQPLLTGQPAVDGGGAGATLGDRPHDQRLAATRVARDEDTGDVGRERGIAGDVAPVVERRRRAARPGPTAPARRSPSRAAPGRPAAHARCPRPARSHRPSLASPARTRMACRSLAPRPVAEPVPGHRRCRGTAVSTRSRPAHHPPRGQQTYAASAARWARASDSSRVPGGSGMISSWVTEAAPWRWTVPTQSAPVSPPPMIDDVPADGAHQFGHRLTKRHAVRLRQVAPSPGGRRRGRVPGSAGRAMRSRPRPARRRRSAGGAVRR